MAAFASPPQPVVAATAVPVFAHSQPDNETKQSRQEYAKYAYVMLVMSGDDDLAGALSLAYSLQNTVTKHEVVCMTTSNISPEARVALRQVCNAVVEVEQFDVPCVPLKTEARKIHKTWISCACTRWACLSLSQYEKVLFLDTQMLVLRNLDHLFAMQAPAAVFVHTQTDLRMVQNYYGHLNHGDHVPNVTIERALRRYGFVVGTAFVLLPTGKGLWERMQDWIRNCISRNKHKRFGFPKCYSGIGAQAVSQFMIEEKQQSDKNTSSVWSHISAAYNFSTCQPIVTDADEYAPGVLRFVQHTPWVTPYVMNDEARRAAVLRQSDVGAWWHLVSLLLKTYPKLDPWFSKHNGLSLANPAYCFYCEALQQTTLKPGRHSRNNAEQPSYDGGAAKEERKQPPACDGETRLMDCKHKFWSEKTSQPQCVRFLNTVLPPLKMDDDRIALAPSINMLSAYVGHDLATL